MAVGRDWNLAVTIVGLLAFLLTGVSSQDYSCAGFNQLTAGYVESYIRSPGYPSSYPNNANCSWRITAPMGHSVRLRIEYMSLEYDDYCRLDNLTLYDGPHQLLPYQLVSLCESDAEGKVYNSSGPVMTVRFRSNSYNASTGFSLAYSSMPAPWASTSNYSTTTPSYMTCIDMMQNCTPSNISSLQAAAVTDEGREVLCATLRGSIQCLRQALQECDYLPDSLAFTLHSSLNRSEEMLNNCSITDFYPSTSTTWPSTSNSTVASSVCGSNAALQAFTYTTQYITSPNYPGRYSSYSSCSWLITAPLNYLVRLSVQELRMTTNYGCSSEYIKLYDGSTEYYSSTLARMCNASSVNRVFYSTGRNLLVKFSSTYSSSYQTRRFKLAFTAIHRSSTPSTTTVSPSTAYPPNTCGGLTRLMASSSTYYSNARYVQSPRYPSSYSGAYNCSWVINAPYGYVVRINVQEMSLQNTSSCGHDSVQIYDGEVPSSYRLLAKMCSSASRYKNVYSSGRTVRIQFRSPGYARYVYPKRFKLRYYAVRPSAVPTTTVSPTIAACRGLANLTATTYSRYIESPGYPTSYYGAYNCSWVIKTAYSTGYVVRIYVQEMNLQGNLSCVQDNVQIYDGSLLSYSRAGLLAKMCNSSSNSKVFYSSGNTAHIQFYSPGNHHYAYQRRFKLRYQAMRASSVPTTTVSPNIAACSGSVSLSAPTSSYTYRYIESPGYPSNYYGAYNCSWVIRTTYSGYVIQINVQEMYLQGNSSCEQDSIQIYDGSLLSYSRAGLLAKMCNSSSNSKVFYSSGNTAHIQFYSPGYQHYTYRRRFKLRYYAIRASSVPTTTISPTIAACSGSVSLTAPTSSYTYRYIESPGYPSNYYGAYNCSWVIRTTYSGYVIRINVQEMYLQGNSSCEQDSIQIYDGSLWSYSRAGLLAKMCNSSSNSKVFYSSGNTAHIQFYSPGNQHYTYRRRFKLRYQAIRASSVPTTTISPTIAACSGMVRLTPLTSSYPYRYIESPGYPSYYSGAYNCSWLVTAPYLYVVRIYVSLMNLHSSTSCAQDSVQIYDGMSASSGLVTKMCNSTSRYKTFYSSGNTARIQFYSPGRVLYSSGKSFRLRYYAVRRSSVPTTTISPSRAACDSTPLLLRASSYSRYIQSINYPGSYSNNMNCNWRITASYSSYRIRVDVMDMDLETSSTCSYDSVKLYDGPSYSSNLLAKMCNRSSSGRVWYSQSNSMTVVFTSDGSSTKSGFKLRYRAVSASSVPSTTPNPAKNAACVGYPLVLRATTYSSGYIQSTNYPYLYPDNMNCKWQISASSSYRIRVDVIAMDLERSTSCTYDSVKLYEGTRYWNPLATMCNSSSSGRVWYSRSNSMTVVFTSDTGSSRSGFKLKYRAVSASSVPSTTLNPVSSCPSQGRMPVSLYEIQYLTSLGYPRAYPSDSNCTWVLTAPTGQLVRVYIVVMDLEYSATCDYDSLTIYDGQSRYSPQLAKLCSTPDYGSKVLMSTGRYMYLRFQSDSATESRGFKLQFEAVQEGDYPHEESPEASPLSSQSENHVGSIIGGVLGSAVAILLVIILVSYLVRRKRSPPSPGHLTAVPSAPAATLPRSAGTGGALATNNHAVFMVTNGGYVTLPPAYNGFTNAAYSPPQGDTPPVYDNPTPAAGAGVAGHEPPMYDNSAPAAAAPAYTSEAAGNTPAKLPPPE